ncbi:MAG: helicase-exonuclease AddAB subunit AddB [Bacillota bacterium]
MGLRFILGRAGSGKTEHCLNSIRREAMANPDGPPLILLVPEQATFQLERELALTEDLGGLMRVHVLSFKRLAWWVFRDEGGLARKHIGELGKKMVLKRLLENRKDELAVFARAAKQPGFLDVLARNLSELKRYLISPRQLGGSAGFFELDQQAALAAKLKEISLLYKDFEEYMEGRFIDPDDYLTLLANKLPAARLIDGAAVWVDEFTGFTPQEYLVLEQLLKRAEQVNVALCLDPGSLDKPIEDEERFYITRETHIKLTRLAQGLNIPIEQNILLPASPGETPYRFACSKDLAHLEKAYAAGEMTGIALECESIKLTAAVNRRAEVEGAAREILRLARTAGYRWKDMAVILRDFEGYHELIQTVFTDQSIPFFMDKKRPVMHHPLIELILSGVQLVMDNWAYEPLFRCLKTDFLPMSRDKVDRIENYVLAHGIKGKAWTGEKPWTYYKKHTLGEDFDPGEREQQELAEINAIRTEVLTILLGFYQALKKAGTVKEQSAVIYDLLEKLKVRQTLDSWSRQCLEKGELEQAREHTQIIGAVNQVFEEMVEALGGETLALDEYLQIIGAGLNGIQLGLIPPGLDQVVVVSLGRSRTPDIKAAFLLGATDGVFPKRPSGEGLLTETEREQLARVGMELAPGENRLAVDEEYLVYTGLTRAGEYLWISYPLADSEGRALMPSMIIDSLKRLFPGIKERLAAIEPRDDEEAYEYLSSPQGVMPILISRLRNLKEGAWLHPMWFALYNWLLEQDHLKSKYAKTLKGLFWVNQEKALPPEVCGKVFPKRLRTSISRLEKYKGCPFAHFLNYGLKLKKRDIYKLEAPDYGQFYHAVLKEFYSTLLARGLTLAEAGEAEVSRFFHEVMDRIAPQLQNEILMTSNRYKYLSKKLKEIIWQSIQALREHARRSEFSPVGLEVAFGYEESTLPALSIKINEDQYLDLTGRIDRVDAGPAQEESYLSVIDYKSGNTNLKLPDIYHGLTLQLLAYLIVCLENSSHFGLHEAKPGGLLYFRIHNPLIKWGEVFDEERVKKTLLKAYKMKGMVLADPEMIRLMDKSLVSGRSDVINNVGLDKAGGFYKGSAVFNEEQFALLKEHFLKTVKETGLEITSGKVTIEPYKKGVFKPCSYCSFKPVCQFDVLFIENNYRLIGRVKDDEVWEALASQKGGDFHG